MMTMKTLVMSTMAAKRHEWRRSNVLGGLWAVMLILLVSCATGSSAVSGTAEPVISIDAAVQTVDKYGNLTLTISTQDLLDQGFAFGDMVTVSAGGNTLDAPFGTGYSDVDNGAVIVRGRADGDANIIIAINMGNFSATYKVAESDAVSIAMKEQGGYFNEWEIRQLKRTNERADYSSDVVFANFRNAAAGTIAPGVLYRSSSPVNNEIGRAAYADALCADAKIAVAINLANSKEELEGYFTEEGFNSPYYRGLYNAGKVVYLSMGVDFTAADFTQKLKQGLEFMIANEGPYVVHCTEGKDRAGFVAGLLEALMGASAAEIKEDYMLSFVNYYHVQHGSEQYNRIAESNILESLRSIAGLKKGADLTGVDHIRIYLMIPVLFDGILKK